MATRRNGALNLDIYLPLDRRQALARGEALPEQATGTALFSDLSGFTPLMEHLSNTLGPQRGAEELTCLLNALFTPMIEEVHRHGGNIIAFGGDALTCWFPDCSPVPGAGRSAACALAMQRHVAAFRSAETPAGPVRFSMKVGLATGSVRRLLAGRPPYGLHDVLAGATMDRMAEAQHRAGTGQTVVDAATAAALEGARLQSLEDGFARLLDVPLLQAPASIPPAPPLPPRLVRPWLAEPLYRRLRAGRGALTGELRLVTSVFVQFSGLDYDHDPQAGEKLQVYVSLAQEHLAPYDGYLALVSCGDKGSLLYILLGAPTAHEDDPARAVGFALAFQKAVQALPFITAQRIGISLGRAYAGILGSAERCTYSVLGDEVNVSARLMQAAAEGQVLVTRRVQKAAGGRYAFRSLGSLALKGKAEPIPIFAPLAAEGDWMAVEEGPLVGREAEQRSIAAVMDRVDAGQGQVLFLLGEAGVGKSALVRHILHQTRARGWNTQLSACLSYGQSTPYLPWRALVEEMARLSPGEDAPTRRARLEQVVAALPDPPRQRGYWPARLPLLGAVLGLEIPDTPLTRSLEGELRRDNTFQLLEALVRSLAAVRPAVVVLEDAHWADELSLLLAAQIGRGLADLPLLLVIVQRPPVAALPAALRALQALPHQVTLTLTALEQASALELARQRLYAASLPPELERLLQEKAQGNPFFIEELVRALLEAGCLRRERDAVTPAGDWSALQLPDNIEGLVQARLDRLPEEDRLTIKVASVIGRAFERPLLREVHPTRLPEPALARQLEGLSRAEFVFLEEADPHWRYAFQHAILHEVTYGTLLFAQRRTLHGEIGAALERRHAADLPRVLDLLAYHYARSAERGKAIHYLQRAAEKARREYANEVALGYYSQALERLSPGESALRYDLLAGRERIHDLLGDREAQEADLLEMGRLAAELADARRQMEVLNRRARRAVDMGALEEARSFAQQARMQAGKLQDAHGIAEAQRTLGVIHGGLGEYDRALRLFERARRAFRATDDPDGEVACLINLGLVHFYQDRAEQARVYYARALEITRGRQNRPQEALTLNNLGLADIKLGSYEAALEHLCQALAIAREVGSANNEVLALENTGAVATYLGNLSIAAEHHHQALLLARKLEDPEGEATSLCSLGQLYTYQDRAGEARAALGESLLKFREIGHRRGEADALHKLGLLELRTGQAGAAVQTLQQALAIRLEIGEAGNALVTRAWLGLAHAQAGEPNLAAAHIRAALVQVQAEGYHGDAPEQEIWWAACQVWRACGEASAARDALCRAWELVQAQSGRIQDPGLRRSFLEEVPVNREIAAAYGWNPRITTGR